MRALILLSLCVFMTSAFAQKAQLKPGIPAAKAKTEQKIAIEPEKSFQVTPNTIKPTPPKGDNPNIVTVLTLGTSANANGYGYAGGQKTLVWADDSLKWIINTHRMGPGATPPSFSGYLAVDKAGNMGQQQSDWTINYQIYAATLNLGGTYFADAGRYPQGAIYNPAGNSDPANAYVAYFAPNLSNTITTWGGYSYGVCNLVNEADSTKHLYWYAPPPYTYIPDGMTITHKKISLVCDVDKNWESGSQVYNGNVILERGVWDDVAKDYVYTMSTIAAPMTGNNAPIDDRIAASPDGNIVWIVTLGNNGGAVQIGDSANYYPILFKSNDGGLTWGSSIAVQLDGPNGINGVKNYMSDYRIQQLFNPPYPTRDQIPYTTAFDCDLVVDMWGNPHIGVVVGVSAGNYSIATADSSFAVFDIYTSDQSNAIWQGVCVGHPWTFRGTFGTLTEDNRTNNAISEDGKFVFITWEDTQLPGVTDNSSPDVFARGFDLVQNLITKNQISGLDDADNVTFLSDITQQATFEATSHYVFTDGTGHILPICTEMLQNLDPTLDVTFKYIPDFEYVPGDYTIPTGNDPFPVSVNDQKKYDNATLNVSPNPFSGTATATLVLKKDGNVKVEMTNMVGQTLMTLNKGNLAAGTYNFTIDGSRLNAGVYFCTVVLDKERYTQKVIVR